MRKKTVVINVDLVVSSKGEFILCEGGPGWGKVGYEGYRRLHGDRMEEAILRAMHKWHKTVHLIKRSKNLSSEAKQYGFTELDAMSLPNDLQAISVAFAFA